MKNYGFEITNIQANEIFASLKREAENKGCDVINSGHLVCKLVYEYNISVCLIQDEDIHQNQRFPASALASRLISKWHKANKIVRTDIKQGGGWMYHIL
mgnify:CR=1 FL=1